MASPLQRTVVQQLSGQIGRAILGFTSKVIEIKVSCGTRFFPMRLKVTEFTSANSQLSSVHFVTSNNGTHVLTKQYPAPVALREFGFNTLLTTCISHVEHMARKLYELTPFTTKRISDVPNRLLQAISRYHDTASPIANVCTGVLH
jgi:hypothetical protein